MTRDWNSSAWRLVDEVDVDVQQAWAGWVELTVRGPAQVDDAAPDVWAAIGYFGHDRPTGVYILDADDRAARQALVSNLDDVGAEDLAARGAIAFEAIARPVG